MRKGSRLQVGASRDIDHAEPQVRVTRRDVAHAVEQVHADRLVAEEDPALRQSEELSAQPGILGAGGESRCAEQRQVQPEPA